MLCIGIYVKILSRSPVYNEIWYAFYQDLSIENREPPNRKDDACSTEVPSPHVQTFATSRCHIGNGVVRLR